MIRAILLASLSVMALAQTSITGLPSCACLGALPTDMIKDVDCTYSWAYNGKCVETVGLVSNFTMYPGDYGESCKVQKEPGASSCFDLTTVPPTEKPTSEQANWCGQKWCYIDPCNCDANDATKSDYFPGTLFYSYNTCGDKNTYTALESATNTVGNAECAQTQSTDTGGDTAAATDTGSTAAATTAAPDGAEADAQSLTIGLGALVLMGVAALA